MIYRRLGNTGMEVSLLGLGTVKFGRNEGVKYPQRFALPDDVHLQNLLGEAQSLGINLIDTAPAYGTSETRLGNLLKHRRKDWLICTKAGEEFVDGASVYDFSHAAITASVHRSLTRLRTDYIDILLIHSDGRDIAIIEQGAAFDAMNALKQAGKVRAIGISVKSALGVDAAVAAGADVVMATISSGYHDEISAVARASDMGVGVMVKKALASGHSGTESLAFAARQRGVSTLVVGTLSTTHLKANVNAVCT